MSRRNEPRVRVDTDGVRITDAPGIRPAVWFAAAALLGLVALLFAVRRGEKSPPPGDLSAAAAPPAAERLARRAADMPDTRPRAPAPPRQAEDGELDAAPVPNASGDDLDELIEAVQALERAQPPAKEATGIWLFPPPGSDPPKAGIIVPEDFPLPEGFVRHYQVTDGGKPLPPILMFHPDYQPVDENGEPLPVPEGRVVPPDMAPPGLPIEIMQPPTDLVPLIEPHDGQAAGAGH